jgi:hypothetical protein
METRTSMVSPARQVRVCSSRFDWSARFRIAESESAIDRSAAFEVTPTLKRSMATLERMRLKMGSGITDDELKLLEDLLRTHF